MARKKAFVTSLVMAGVHGGSMLSAWGHSHIAPLHVLVSPHIAAASEGSSSRSAGASGMLTGR